jgi:hypothetical protein
MEYVVPFQERKELKETLYPLHFWERKELKEPFNTLP